MLSELLLVQEKPPKDAPSFGISLSTVAQDSQFLDICGSTAPTPLNTQSWRQPYSTRNSCWHSVKTLLLFPSGLPGTWAACWDSLCTPIVTATMAIPPQHISLEGNWQWLSLSLLGVFSKPLLVQPLLLSSCPEQVQTCSHYILTKTWKEKMTFPSNGKDLESCPWSHKKSVRPQSLRWPLYLLALCTQTSKHSL